MIREAQIEKIDAAQHALSYARREHGDDGTAARQAGERLNEVVDAGTMDEIRAWASRANERAGWR